jgi:peroxiredoxin Q/BCP
MAQLRRDFEKFEAVETTILVVGPENEAAFAKYWEEHGLPFIGIPDPKHKVLKLFGQEVKLFKLGRMPAQVIVDKESVARYAHYGHSMSDIPENEELLAILNDLT